MKVRYADPSKPIRDPADVNRRHVGIAPDGKPLAEFSVAETSFWVRRVLSGELVRIDNPGHPVPITPLTTR